MLQTFKRQLKKFILAGDNSHCPCCGNSFVTFMPFDTRYGAECPVCISLERHRLISLYIAKNSLFKDNSKKMLHIAPEKCLARPFKDFFQNNYLAGDKFTDGYTGYDKNTVEVDITALQFENNSFDFVVCNHVLEHVPEDMKAMKELYRVLKPGGLAILQVPLEMDRKVTYEDPTITDPAEREKHFGQYDHVRIYGADYLDRLTAAGFKVKMSGMIPSLSVKEIFKYGLDKNEDLLLCTK